MTPRKMIAIAVMGSLWLGCGESEQTSDDDRGDETDGTGSVDEGAASDEGAQTGPDGSSKPSNPRDGAAGGNTGKGDAGTSEPPPGKEPSDKPPTKPAPFDYENETVELKKDLVVKAGDTLRVGPGVTFVATGAETKLQVLGTLEVEGSEEKPVNIRGTGGPRSWHGVVVGDGGSLKLDNAVIGGAAYGIYAEPGSTYAVDNSVIETSFKAAVLESDGSFSNTLIKAAIPPNIAITDEVGVDDPNGAMTIINASPTVTNCQFDGASPFTDLVRIGGESSPVFDHVYLRNAHCAFHTFGGVNSSPKILNALIENFSYGFMAYKAKPIVEDSVFKGNLSDFGLCNGATAENAPALKNNFYSSGAPALDSSCFRIGTTDPSVAAAANPNAGVTGF